MEAKSRAEQIYADLHKCLAKDGIYDAKTYQQCLAQIYKEIADAHFAQVFPRAPPSHAGGAEIPDSAMDWGAPLEMQKKAKVIEMQQEILKNAHPQIKRMGTDGFRFRMEGAFKEIKDRITKVYSDAEYEADLALVSFLRLH